MSTGRNKQRTLTARSVLLSVLLGSDPPRLPTQLLVRTTELFGIAEGTARTALSRMAAAGEVAAHGGAYEITGTGLLRRQARQQASRVGSTTPWTGAWRQGVVGIGGPRPADERAAIRTELLGARFAELREGIWLRPDNFEHVPAIDGVRWFGTTPAGDPGAFAAELWDLTGWATEADSLRRRMAELITPLDGRDRTALADGFVLSAAVLRQFQSDPLLPDVLLPNEWPGASLRREYDRYDRAYRDVLQDWFHEQG